MTEEITRTEPTGTLIEASTEEKTVAKATPLKLSPRQAHKQMLAEYYQLTDAHKVFCEEYLSNGRKPILAYKKAWPDRAEKAGDTMYLKLAARSELKHPKVQKYLQYADDQAHKRIDQIIEKYAVSRERIVEELARVAFSRPNDVQSWDEDGVTVKPSSELTEDQLASIAEVKAQKTKDGTVVNIKQHDRVNALVQLGKEFGMFKSQLEVKAVVGAKFIIDEGE